MKPLSDLKGLYLVSQTKKSVYVGTNLLFSPPGLLGKASISIGAQAETAAGLTTGMPDHALLLEEICSRSKRGVISGQEGEENLI